MNWLCNKCLFSRIFLKMFLILLIFLRHFYYVSPTYKDTSEDVTSIVQCLIKGQELFSSKSKLILLSLPAWEKLDSDTPQSYFRRRLIGDFSAYKKWSFLIFNTKTENVVILQHSTEIVRVRNFIVNFKHLQELKSLLKTMKKFNLINSHGKYLFVSTVSYTNATESIKNAFDLFGLYRILDSMLFLKDSKDNSSLNVFSSMPFDDHKCGLTENIKLIDTCKNGVYKHNALRGIKKLPKLFKSCQLKVMYVDVPPYAVHMQNYSVIPKVEFFRHGLEVGILTHIFSYMNVSLLFMKSDNIGTAFEDGNASGSLKSLVDRQANIVIGGYAQTLERVKYFDTSYPYGSHYLVWIVPNDHIGIGELFNIGNIIRDTVWYISALLIMSSTLIVVIVASNSENEKVVYKHPFKAIRKVVLVMSNVPINALPKKHGVRLIFCLILAYGLIFNAAFTTYLTSVLMKGGHRYHKYNTIEDILKYNLSVYFSPNAQRFFLGNSTLEKTFMSRFKTCLSKNFDLCLGEVAFSRNASFFVDKEYVDFQISRYAISWQLSLIKILPSRSISSPMNLIMEKGFWGYRKVDTLLGYAISSGLIKKWTNALTFSEEVFVHRTENTLKLKNIKSVLYILALGFSSATTAFIFEILIYTLRKWSLKFYK